MKWTCKFNKIQIHDLQKQGNRSQEWKWLDVSFKYLALNIYFGQLLPNECGFGSVGALLLSTKLGSSPQIEQVFLE